MHSYRVKLLAYTLALLVLLVASLGFTYRYVYALIDEEGRQHLAAMATLLHSHLEAERLDDLRNAKIVARYPRVGEYLFAVVEIGTEPEPLRILYEREFRWMPADRFLILSRDNRILVGDDAADLALQVRNARHRRPEGTFYFYNRRGLQHVAYAPIYYQNRFLGTAAIGRVLDRRWLREQPQNRNGVLFLSYGGRIIDSARTALAGLPIDDGATTVEGAAHRYRLTRLQLLPAVGDVPVLWLGLDETALRDRLDRHRRIIFLIAGSSALVILLFGLLIIRQFTRPLSELVAITREVAEGRLPELPKSTRQDEIAVLANHFADMLQALRRKEEEVAQARAELQKTATTDSLTGLYNRRHLGEVFPKLLARARRQGSSLFGILIDLDKFKPINDTHGHICGDRVLERFAARLREHSRANDYLFRMGGEEFLVLTETGDRAGVVALAEKLRQAMATLRVACNGQTLGFTISCGVSEADPRLDTTASLRDMLSRADAALYRAKQSGRNRVCVDGEAPCKPIEPDADTG